MYGNMQANYGAYGMQPPQQYLMPPQQQAAPVQQTVAPVSSLERQEDRNPRSVRAYGNPPVQRRPLPVQGTGSAMTGPEPTYAAPVVHSAAIEQSKAVGLGKLLGVAIGAHKPSATRGKSPFGTLW